MCPPLTLLPLSLPDHWEGEFLGRLPFGGTRALPIVFSLPSPPLTTTRLPAPCLGRGHAVHEECMALLAPVVPFFLLQVPRFAFFFSSSPCVCLLVNLPQRLFMFIFSHHLFSLVVSLGRRLPHSY